MAPLLLLVLLLVVAFWLGKEFSHARRRKAFLATRDSRGRPMLPPHQRITEAELAIRVRSLRAALKRGDVALDEAVGSLVRYAGGGMTPEAARQLLDS